MDHIKYQLVLLDQLKKSEINFKKTPKERLKRTYIETRLESLEQLWNDFREGHKNIIMKIPIEKQKDISYFEENTYENFEEFYINYKSSLKECLQISSKKELPSMPVFSEGQKSNSTEIRLPTIQLPTFSGKYEEWQTFYDLFTTLIHDNIHLSSVQKLHYLKCNLSGEQEIMLRNYSITDANYMEAWNTIVNRYNNKRFNCNAILRILFSQKSIQNESANNIKQLVDTTSTCLKSLSNIGIKIENWDLFIIYLVISKLDTETMKQWEQHISLNKCDLPTWPQLACFLESRFRSLEMIESNKVRSGQVKPTTKPKVFHSNVTRDGKKYEIKCALCSEEHYLYYCKKFSNMSPKERQDFVQNNKLCFNCLAPTHSVIKCRQSSCCKKCGRRHHSLLHFEREYPPVKNTEGVSTSITSGNHMGSSGDAGIVSEVNRGKPNTLLNDKQIVSHFSSQQNYIQTSNVLLATAQILVSGKNGYKHVFRALLDQGSQASFVTEATVQLLNLSRSTVSGWVSGVGNGKTRIKHMVSICMESGHNPEVFFRVDAYVLRSLTTLLPTTDLRAPEWFDLHKGNLADPEYTTPGKIDIILGTEVYSNILLDGIIKHPNGNLLAQNTALGWVVTGRLSRDLNLSKKIFTSLHVQVKDDELLKQFWELENEPNSIQKRLSKEEQKCEEIYNTTTFRDNEGRFVVKLPFKEEDPECQYGGLGVIAARRFEILEKRLMKNCKLRDEYHKVMDEYINLQHMIPVEEKDIDNPRAVYLPHHAVIREDKDTTKVRIVFDASCKGTNNVSLNDNLLIGPKLQQDLRHILMRWRSHKICISADIIKMYRMVRVTETDLNFQRVLWRPLQDGPIQHYKLTRLTFGTACAPYLAVKTLQTLAEEEQSKCPIASTITKNDFYIDDLLTGCESINEAIQIYREMNKLMNLGGFELQKWSSNCEALLKHIGENKTVNKDNQLPLIGNSLIKVLGVSWNRDRDIFEYTLKLSEVKLPITKRQILSEVAKLYDPLGWIAPVVVIAKIIIQKLWRTKLEWDEDVTGALLEEWLQYREDLIHIKEISIPRWIGYSKQSKTELHVFADASQDAYGAVVYARVITADQIFVSLMSAKTKVAPIEKKVSIPRLELCSAVLAAKLISEVAQVMQIPKANLFAWSDSKIVLGWLKGGPSRWSTFVSNRVSDILNILDYEQWGHVSTEMNPADCTSRGLKTSALLSHNLWWSGPAWLCTLKTEWSSMDIEDTHEEEKICTLTALFPENSENLVWYKFSSLPRMLRVISYCKRFLNLKLPRHQRKSFNTFVTTEEINETLLHCVKQVQEISFNKEIKQLQSQECVPKNSVLRSLCPFLDQKGILRVCGRIQQSQIEYDTQHPMILPAKNHLSRLIILDAHQKTMHGGPQIMLNYIRSKFWIVRAKDQIKHIFRACVTCRRYSKINNVQLMGQFPEARLKPCKPFRSTGVDYAGPINIRFSPGRGSKSYKGYICLFVCMVTRAIHLEAVTDMTAKGFIASFRRFTSRRGHCQDLYSDNGTNFVGANKQLNDMFHSAQSSITGEIVQLLTLERTTWHFIPPHAPNFGGLWEAGVRSTKMHLHKVIGDTKLTYEELTTVLTQIEACLNSRPITILSDNPNDPLPLTPGHFLIGEPLINLVDENYCNNKDISNLDRWRFTQKLVNNFWNRWHKEYLVSLNQRYKWNKKVSEPEIDDIVILKEDNIPPCKWILGRIIQKHSGPDCITRVVTVKCQHGVFKRPISKLVILYRKDK